MDHTEHMKASKNTSLANPCLDRLSDMEYLEHMIPHHQVAIDMSHMLEPSTSSDVMLNLCRNIIRNQKLEIWEMKRMKQYPVARGLFSDDEWLRENIITKLDTYNPILSRAKEGPCTRRRCSAGPRSLSARSRTPAARRPCGCRRSSRA